MYHPLPYDTAEVRCERTDLAFLRQHPCHFECGIYLICLQGEAVISTGIEQYVFTPQTELIFLTGSLMQLLQATPDFEADILMIPQEVFLKAMLPIDTPYFNYAHEHPCYRHTPDERSQKTWHEIVLWMELGQTLFSQNGNSPYRALQEFDYIQGLLIWLFGTVPEKIADPTQQYSRKQLLCYQFMHLLREYSTREHQVAFYADKLCITPRYLNQITAQCMDGRTPKELIDEQITAEIKVLLHESHLTVTEIAQQLHFADQSNMSRFFRKDTGLTPKQFRRQMYEPEA